jgi:cbb3-type cytochrome oxidase subunit 3
MEIKEEKNNTKLVIIWGIVLYVVFIFALLMIKANSTAFTLQSFLIWFGAFTLFFSCVIAGYWILNKSKKGEEIEKKNSKLPNPITTDEGMENAKKIIQGKTYGDYLETPKFCGSENLGESGNENTIFHFIGDGYFKNKKTGVIDKYAILINSHYPSRYTVLINAKDAEISRAKNKLCLFPKEAPGRTIIQERNPLLGTERIETTTLPVKKEENEKPKEDLK